MSSRPIRNIRLDGRAEVREVHVEGDWAWIRNHIDLTLSPTEGEPLRPSGYTLTILKRCPDGRWRLFRDANLVS